MNSNDKKKYEALARSGIPANEFYRILKDDRVRKTDIFVLLRDDYSLNLLECLEIAKAQEE